MSRKKPRGLRPDEAELWQRVTERAVPMHPQRPMQPESIVLPAGLPTARPAKKLKGIKTFQLGQSAMETAPPHNFAPTVSERLASDPISMDAKAFTKLKRGKLLPERRIDLHGMTIAQAHPVLIRFILDAHSDGTRLALVITGKGKDRDDNGPIPTRRGILKQQVPHWLSLPPLRSVVLQVTEAHLRHGGTGAYYVYLRRQK